MAEALISNHVEYGLLAVVSVPLEDMRGIHVPLNRVQEFFPARSRKIECPAFYEAFYHFLLDFLESTLLRKINERGKRDRASYLQYLLYGRAPDVLYRAKPVTNPVVRNRKLHEALV